MSRDAAGNYTLPLADVESGTLITSTWANTTMDDLAASMTDSLSRSGNGAMQAPLKHTNGLENAPSVTFNGDILTGFYSAAIGDMRATVSGIDRMRWLAANQFPQIWDNDSSEWSEIGAGGVAWIHSPVIPATSVINKGYVTAGSQSTLMPANPTAGHSIAFADLNDDWSSENPLTLNGNGNSFTQDNTEVYNLDLKGAFAQFSYLDGQWQIVNFARLSDAYGYDLQDYYTINQTNALLANAVNPNLLINSGFDIWQRGAGPFLGNVYTADRWRTIANNTVNRSTDVPDESAPYSISVAGDNIDSPTLRNSIELTNPTIGPAQLTNNTDYTLSFWGKRAAIDGFTVVLGFSNVVGSSTDFVQIDTHSTENSTIGEWQKYTYTFNIGASIPNVNNLAFEVRINAAFPTAAETMFLALVKLEVGTVATVFTRAGNTMAGELSMCQRYYFNNKALGGVNRIQGIYDEGVTNIKYGNAQFPTVMRINPILNVIDYFGYGVTPPTFAVIGTSSSVFSGTALATELSGVDEYTAYAEL
jgi:hypothetical protein